MSCLLCDESSLSPEHHHQGSACCFSISLFTGWHILPASSVSLASWIQSYRYGIYKNAFFNWFFRRVLYDPPLWCLVYSKDSLETPSCSLHFPFPPIYSTLQSFLTSCPWISVITRTLFFYYKLEEFSFNTFLCQERNRLAAVLPLWNTNWQSKQMFTPSFSGPQLTEVIWIRMPAPLSLVDMSEQVIKQIPRGGLLCSQDLLPQLLVLRPCRDLQLKYLHFVGCEDVLCRKMLLWHTEQNLHVGKGRLCSRQGTKQSEHVAH